MAKWYYTNEHQPLLHWIIKGTNQVCSQLTMFRALWFPWSWNCGQNRRFGRLKRNLLLNAEYHRIWHNFTEMLFCVEEERMSEENCTEGSKSGWHNKFPPPRQNNVSVAKWLPKASSSSTKKLRDSTLTPRYRAEQFPNNLYVSGELLFYKEADLRNHN